VSNEPAPVDAEVLVVGDANLDLVLRGDVVPRFGQAEQLLAAADLTLGGSASLVAHGLARLGVRVALVAAVGDDAFGAMTLELLAGAGVDTTQVVRRPAGATGLSVILSPAEGERAILTHLGVIDSLTPADLPEPGAQVRHVHVASPYLVNGVRDLLPPWLHAQRSAGRTVSVDTNDDPARAWTGLRTLLAAADEVLPNRDEVRRWASALGLPDGSWQEAARAVASLGPRVIVKAGAEGGQVFGPEGALATVRAQPVTPVDTTGAGDSFDAGWIAGCLAGLAPEQALGWAVAAGSLSTRAAGGAPGQPTAEELAAALGSC
jgi:sugar/nucleoside kinase (ribokinase family)